MLIGQKNLFLMMKLHSIFRSYPNMKMYDINQNRIEISDKLLITEHDLVTRFKYRSLVKWFRS